MMATMPFIPRGSRMRRAAFMKVSSDCLFGVMIQAFDIAMDDNDP